MAGKGFGERGGVVMSGGMAEEGLGAVSNPSLVTGDAIA